MAAPTPAFPCASTAIAIDQTMYWRMRRRTPAQQSRSTSTALARAIPARAGGRLSFLPVSTARKSAAASRTPRTTRWSSTAAVGALKALKRNGLSVTIYTDSMLVVNLLSGAHQTKKPHLAVLVQEAKELVAAKNLRCDWFHVNGHSGDPGNERANALARSEARKAKQCVAGQTRTGPPRLSIHF